MPHSQGPELLRALGLASGTTEMRPDSGFRNIPVLMITPPGTLPTGTKLALASQFSLTAALLARGVIAWFSTGGEVVGSVQGASFLTLRHVSLVDIPSLLQYISDSKTPTDLAACLVQAARSMSTFRSGWSTFSTFGFGFNIPAIF